MICIQDTRYYTYSATLLMYVGACNIWENYVFHISVVLNNPNGNVNVRPVLTCSDTSLERMPVAQN